ncbi:MAG: hypothetical protein QM597_09370 [Aeromicrobium sp.]|uniref:hypothetical protein n=1 Tax=Aeromicrobium sp. TaxID=1871063 RepID=UPI0039E3791C
MNNRIKAGVAAVALVVAAGCGGGTEGGSTLPRKIDPDSARHIEKVIDPLPGVVSVEAERTAYDSDYYGVEATVIVEDDIEVPDLEAVLEVFDEANNLIDEAAGFNGEVRFERDEDEDITAASHILSDESPLSPAERASAFLTATSEFPEAKVVFMGPMLDLGQVPADGRRVSEIAAWIMADDDLGLFPSIALSVSDSVEGTGQARIWVDGDADDFDWGRWQQFVDTVALIPAQAAPTFSYILVRDDRIGAIDLGLGGDLPEDVVPDFTTWQPVLEPSLQAIFAIGAAQGDDDGWGLDVSGGDSFVGVWVKGGSAEADGYADDMWSQWAADVVNAA